MIHWGFIGCGDVVERKSGKPFWQAGKSEVVAVMCRNIERAKSFASRNDIAHYYDDVMQLIADPAVDAIYIATPPSTHMPYAKLALEAGKPVYVEKPMGLAVAECEEVWQLAQQKNIPLFVAYYRRALPYYVTVKQLLQEGAIGAVRAVNVLHYTAGQGGPEEWRTNPEIAGGGWFHDMGCHTLDILDEIFGPIVQVTGRAANLSGKTRCADAVSAQFTFENGVLGTAQWCFDAAINKERMQVIGDKGELTFHIMGDVMTLTVGGEEKEIQVPHPAFIQECMIQNVIDCLMGNATAMSTGETALRTARVMEAIVG